MRRNIKQINGHTLIFIIKIIIKTMGYLILCQLDWVSGCPVSGSTSLRDASVRAFPDVRSIWSLWLSSLLPLIVLGIIQSTEGLNEQPENKKNKEEDCASFICLIVEQAHFTSSSALELESASPAAMVVRPLDPDWITTQGFFFFFNYIYWLCYDRCPISPRHSTPSCTPPPSHIPPL